MKLYGYFDAGIFQEPFTLTCNAETTIKVFVTWTKESSPIAPLAVITGGYNNGSCIFDGDPSLNYTFTCDPSNGLYNMTISRSLMTNSFHMTTFRCSDLINNLVSNIYTLNINIPVSNASLKSTPNNENPVQVNDTATQTFECTTDAIRPSATVNWFLGTTNITYLGKATTVDAGQNLVLSLSNIIYTGARNDSGKTLYCTAANIANSDVIPSTKKILRINYGPDIVIISPAALSYTINEVVDSVGPISCAADCMPKCTMTWSGPNISNNTTPILMLQNITRNQTGDYHCTASNNVNSTQSNIIKVTVRYGPSRVQLTPSNTTYTVNETANVVGPISCTSVCIPDCTIKWFGPNNFTSATSVLNLHDIRRNQSGDYQCTASNIVSSMQSFPIKIIVQYGPGKVMLSPSIQSYTVNETADSVGPISCTADCIPNCSMTWSISNISTGTTSVLNIQNITRNQSGDYQCTASNVVSSMKSNMVKVIVQYGPNKVNLLPSTQSYTVNETSDSVGPISCTADCLPNCSMAWSGQNFPTVSTSVLNLTNIKRSQFGEYWCKASNIVNNMQSMNIKVIVQYGPDKVLLSPSTSSYTINETADSIGPISCAADCIPNCTMAWYSQNVSVDTTSILQLQNIKRNQTGDYHCKASNIVSSMQSTNIGIIVQYKPRITRLSGNFSVEENDTVVMDCMVDSLPDSNIEWIFDNSGIKNQRTFDIKLLGKSTNIQLSQLRINRTECLLMGNYSCQAFNILGSVVSAAGLTVNCEPRVALDVPTTISVGDSQPINLTIQIIAYPAPRLYWAFKADNASSVNVTTNITNTFGINRHTSNLFIYNPDDKNFGHYFIYAYNVAGRVQSIHSFNVIPERKPGSPENFTCHGELNYVNVHWISGFNGGRQQNFSVYYSEHVSDIADDFHEYDVIPDKGQGKNITAKIYPLFPGKCYSFKVIARNVHSYSESDVIVCNTTTEVVLNTQTDNSTVLGAAFGVSSAIIVFLTVGVVIFLVKRKHTTGKEKGNERAKHKDDEDDDGLIDNILYQSIGSNFECQSTTRADIYAVVEKKVNCLQVDGKTTQETSLSKGMQINVKKNIKGEMYVDDSAIKELKRKDKQRKHEDVYENTEHTAGDNHLNQRKENRNKDGLQYADLLFNPSPNGAKFIIHGLDDRIIYADIDTTQSIDPLPECDNEEAN